MLFFHILSFTATLKISHKFLIVCVYSKFGKFFLFSEKQIFIV